MKVALCPARRSLQIAVVLLVPWRGVQRAGLKLGMASCCIISYIRLNFYENLLKIEGAVHFSSFVRIYMNDPV